MADGYAARRGIPVACRAARAALIIPVHFGRDLACGANTTPVQLMVDATDANTAKLLQGFAAEITQAYSIAGSAARPQPVRADIRLWYNPGRVSKKFYGPGIFVLGISMFPPLLAALAMSREGEQKTILQVYVSNISAHEFLLGKIFAFMVIALAEWSVAMPTMLHLLRAEPGGRSDAATGRDAALYVYGGFVRDDGWRGDSKSGGCDSGGCAGRFSAAFLLSGLTVFPHGRTFRPDWWWISNIVGQYYIAIVRDALLQGGGWPSMRRSVARDRRLSSRCSTRWRGSMRRMQLSCWRPHPMQAGSGFGGVWGALIRKEFTQIRRDRRLAISLVVPPTLQLLLFGFALDSTVSHLRLGIVDDAHSAESRELSATFTESKSFQLAGSYATVTELGKAISLGKLDAGVVIPYDFSKDLERGRQTTVQILINAVNANTAAIAQGYAQGVLRNYNLQVVPQGGIHAQVRQIAGYDVSRRGGVQMLSAFLYNPGLVTAWFIVTGTFGTLLILNGSLIASTALIKERERGTVEQLLMTPATTHVIRWRRSLPAAAALLCVMILFATGLIRFVFHVPIHGSLALVWSGAALCVLSGIGIGTFIATVTKSAQQAQLMSFFVNPPIAMLSGSLTPIEAMPKWIQPLTIVNPVRHFGVIARGVMVKGSGLDALLAESAGTDFICNLAAEF